MGGVLLSNHKYAELAAGLRADIRNGKYRDGEKLPSENELAATTGCSRQTVRQAIGILESEGLLDRIQGSGTFARNPAPKREKTNNIAVVTTYIGEYIFPDILRGINDVLSENGYTPLLYATGNRIDNERRILSDLINKPIDGLIVEGTKTALPNPNIDIYEKMAVMGIPVVFINGWYSDLRRSVYVAADDKAGGRMACERLLKSGHRHIAGIFKSDDIQGHNRYAGYIEALRDAGLIAEKQHVMWFTTEDRESQISTGIVQLLEGCDALVCYNDEVAIAVLNKLGACRSANKTALLKQIEIVSFDNSTYAQMSSTPFVSLSCPKLEIGTGAAKKIIGLLNNMSEKSEVFPWKTDEK